MPEMWTLAEISKQYGAKRRTLLEWCGNSRWRGLARMEGSGGTKQWMVPDEVVKAEFKNQVIDSGNKPPALPPTEMIQASYEAMQALARGMASSMAVIREELQAAKDEATAAKEQAKATQDELEAAKQEIVSLRESLAVRLADEEAKRKREEERQEAILEAVKQSRFRWPWQK